MAARFKGLLARLGTALVLLPLCILLIWYPPMMPVFIVFIILLAGIGQLEYYSLAQTAGHRPERVFGTLAGIAVIGLAALGDLYQAAIGVSVGSALLAIVHIHRPTQDFAGLATSVFGVVYVGWFAAHLVLLHHVEHYGPGLVTYLITVIALADSGAYFAGKYLGRHKLAPVASPNKTFEGALGGIAAGVAGAFVLYSLRGAFLWADRLPPWALWEYLVTAAILVVVSIYGDLLESVIKRAAGAKDAGSLFPGHGGVLDRCDGILFAAPLFYYGIPLLDWLSK